MIQKLLKFFFIFLLIFTWIFSGWPGILKNEKSVKIFTQTKTALADTGGPNDCATSVNTTGIGSIAWTNPSNACVSGQSTTATNVTSANASNWLKVTNFGFSIPAGATIDGISVTVSRSTTANKGNRAIDNAARIIKGGVIGSTDKANSSQWNTTPVTYGSTSDTWGESWTIDDINASTFGFAVSAKSTGANAVSATVNAFITITVTYSLPVVSVSVSDGTVSYGTLPTNSSRSTLLGDLNDVQSATNNGNVTENFNIKGQDTACPWTLSASSGSEQYVHQFCNSTVLNCTSPPTNYTALTTGYQALGTGIAASGMINFQLRITTPANTSCYTQQSVDVTIQAVQQ